MKVHCITCSMNGGRRKMEDSVYTHYYEESDMGIFIVCDGMGGHRHGKIASRTVCNAMGNYILSHHDPDEVFTETSFQKALGAAYDALDSVDDGAEKKMGTTLAFVLFHAGGCFLAHIGDSRIYQVRPGTGEILHKTRDHSLVNSLLDIGEITPEEAKVFNQKNVITRAMQPHQERRTRADVTNVTDICPGDYFYMCSDGMLERSEDSDIVNVLSMDCPDAEKVRTLKEETQANKDNHSAFIIKVLSTK